MSWFQLAFWLAWVPLGDNNNRASSTFGHHITGAKEGAVVHHKQLQQLIAQLQRPTSDKIIQLNLSNDLTKYKNLTHLPLKLKALYSIIKCECGISHARFKTENKNKNK